MVIKQFLNECISEAAYYIESEGESAIIDPLRDIGDYLKEAGKSNASIKYIFETHFHADFVSGHQQIAEATGATIVYGPTATPLYPAHIARDTETFSLGKLTIEVLHTPGHSLESACYLLRDETGTARVIFTGDTLLLGDVGRPDLAQELRAEFTPEFLAGLQYDAIQNKIQPLSDDIVIYPGHFKGSPCGKHLDNAYSDTLGNQRKTNFALKNGLSRNQFIEETLKDLPAPPPHFAFNVLLNQQGGLPSVEQVIRKGMKPIAASDFLRVREQEDALIIDTRNRHAFPEAFIPGALFFGLEENFSHWIGTIVNNLQQPLLLVTTPGEENEVITRLSHIGHDRVIGFLQGGMEAWLSAGLPTEKLQQTTTYPSEVQRKNRQFGKVLDLRPFDDYQEAHLSGAHSFPLEFLQRNLKYLPADEQYYLYCSTGYRSLIAASCMKAKGYLNVTHIAGGMRETTTTGIHANQAG